LRLYEGMFLLDDARCSENFHAATREVHAILEKNQAEVFTAEKWDERKLCYPIKGRSRAVYYLVRFTASAEGLVGIERDGGLNDTILRLLVLRDEQSEKLHKAGLLAVRPGEPGEPIQTLSQRVRAEAPAPAAGRSESGPRRDEGEAEAEAPRGRHRDEYAD